MTNLPWKDIFEDLAKTNQKEFVNILLDKETSNGKLSWGAEYAGEMLPQEVCIPVLFELSDHDSSLVREGVVYGLEHHIHREDVINKLKLIAEKDPAKGVRKAAAEALEDLKIREEDAAIEENLKVIKQGSLLGW